MSHLCQQWGMGSTITAYWIVQLLIKPKSIKPTKRKSSRMKRHTCINGEITQVWPGKSRWAMNVPCDQSCVTRGTWRTCVLITCGTTPLPCHALCFHHACMSWNKTYLMGNNISFATFIIWGIQVKQIHLIVWYIGSTFPTHMAFVKSSWPIKGNHRLQWGVIIMTQSWPKHLEIERLK